MPDQTATIDPSLVEVLPAETVRQTGFTHKFTIPYTQINNAAWTTDGDTVTLTLGRTPTKWLVDKVAVDIKTAFTTDGTLTIQIGTDGDPDNFLDAQDALTAALLLADTSATIKTETASFGIASDVLVARFTTQAATGAPADIDAGEAVVWLAVRDLAS
jgi:hypothetical protein